MNKRGDVTWDEIVKAIPTVILVLLLVWAGVRIWNATHPEQFSTEKKDLKRITAEIKDLKVGDNPIIVPIFSSLNYSLKAANTAKPDDKRAYIGCNMDYCVCFFDKDTPITCETFNLRDSFGLVKDEYQTVSFTVNTKQGQSLINLERTDRITISVS